MVGHPRIPTVANKSAKMGGGQQGHRKNAKMEQGDLTPTPRNTASKLQNIEKSQNKQGGGF